MGKDVLVQQLVDSFDSWPAKNSGCGSSRMTQELYPFDKLFSPIKINKLTVKNRIVMAMPHHAKEVSGLGEFLA